MEEPKTGLFWHEFRRRDWVLTTHQWLQDGEKFPYIAHIFGKSFTTYEEPTSVEGEGCIAYRHLPEARNLHQVMSAAEKSLVDAGRISNDLLGELHQHRIDGNLHQLPSSLL